MTTVKLITRRIKLWMAYLNYARKWHFGWPGRLQRLHMQGDPTGEVARLVAAIRKELEDEEAS
jgi:hypothetical protein